MVIHGWSLLKHRRMMKVRIGKGFLPIYVYNSLTTLDNLKKIGATSLAESCRYTSR